MSGLAALLAKRHEPGIFRWHSGFSVADVQHTVEHAGWRFVYLDGHEEETAEEFLRGIGKSFGFSDEYRHDFDSLADHLSDVVPADREGTVLLWDSWSPFARADEQAFSVALSALGSRVNADRGGPLVVLMRGEGPDVPGVGSVD